MSQELEPGYIINDRFELLGKLGQGGFGVVYRARQLSTSQEVAVKFLQPERLAALDKFVQNARFEREMRLIGQLKHPNIVRLIDSGRLETEDLFLVLEYIDGEPLSEVLEREGKLEPVEAHQLMLQVIDALSCAHSHGIVHRDLKPSNIMITQTGTRRNATVLDFGIAGVVQGRRELDYASLTDEGQLRGTPQYMAPEQLLASSSVEVCPESDIYAWGLVFIECLTGQHPIQGASLPSIIFAQLSDEPVPLPEGIEGHPIRELLMRATAKKIEQRLRSAGEVVRRLENCPLRGLSKRNIRIPEELLLIASPDARYTPRPRRTESASNPVHITDTLDHDGGAVNLSTDNSEFEPHKTDKNALDDMGELVTLDARDSDVIFSQAEGAAPRNTEGPQPDEDNPPRRPSLGLAVSVGLILAVGALIAVYALSERNEASGSPSLPRQTAHDVPADAVTPQGQPAPTTDAEKAPPSERPRPRWTGPMAELPDAAVLLGIDAELRQELAQSKAFAKHDFDLARGAAVMALKTFRRPALEVMTTEVTWEQWQRAMTPERAQKLDAVCPRPLPERNTSEAPTPEYAVTGIGAAEAQAFCETIGMTLPSAQVWEAIARGPRARSRGFVGELDDTRREALSRPHPAGALSWNATPEGVFDLSGGVREWVTCDDDTRISYCSEGFGHRGGSWDSDPFWWFAFVVGYSPQEISYPCSRENDIGFRCVRIPPRKEP